MDARLYMAFGTVYLSGVVVLFCPACPGSDSTGNFGFVGILAGASPHCRYLILCADMKNECSEYRCL